MRKRLYRMFIELTNRKWSSKLVKKFTMSKISKYLIPSFIKFFQINIDEIEKDLKQYSSLHDFFIRKLKPGARKIDQHPYSVISPVDGTIESFGEITENAELFVKNQHYSFSEMLGDDFAALKYKEGFYFVIYLSPSNYHRIHSPITGKIIKQWKLGDRSYPVNRLGLTYGKKPLVKNFRYITEISHENGTLAVVKIGAMFVNSIETIHPSNQLSRGEEFAYFSFGSTVVLLFEKGTFQVKEQLKAHQPIKMGDLLGFITQKK